ncbi:DNA gyrase subunit A [PVC group bacterium (ex Bugula neritina AB1)]|nr:DNA gyrase subunit A [PVC group bacterium (ex Bugula neritina AB1)]
MSDLIEGKIIDCDIEEEMKNSYTTYAMSVIISRALPDTRDGLKPSQRRILFAMKELGLSPNKKHRKCAKIAGDTSGNYHPHGEQVVYPTLVRMAQSFSMRYMLVDGQGNFGSVDGDPPAAMRYTEARMQEPARFLMEDIDKKTVDFVPNYDETLTEPSVLPAKFPNLLCNGSTGIAVGMATNIPPHNIRNVASCINKVIDEPDVAIPELIELMEGPDFPTGGIICGKAGIYSAYTTGRGVIKIRARVEQEDMNGGKTRLVITEIPYQINKTNLIQCIVSLVQNKVMTNIADIRDESDKDGIRLVIETKRDENPEIVLNQLYKHSQLQVSYGINMLALVDARPKLLNLKELVLSYVNHRRDIVTRRTQFELDKAERRAHILEGLRIARDHIDEVIHLIRSSKTSAEAKLGLIEKFKMTEIQAQAVLEMQLQRLTGLERDKLEEEYQKLLMLINDLKSVLASDYKIDQIIKDELSEVVEKNGDNRRTDLTQDSSDIDIEDLIPSEDMVVTITHTGYIKALPTSTYRKQNRGGRGVTGMGTGENDFVQEMFVANSHDYLLFFTNRGRVYWQKVYQLPQGSRVAKGKAIVNLLNLSEDEKVQAYIPIKTFKDDEYLIFVSKKGLIKKSKLVDYSRPRSSGIIALTIEEGDELIDVIRSHGEQDVLISTHEGMAIRFNETDVRVMGRSAKGVRAIKLKKEHDFVVGVVILDTDMDILTVSQNGYCKKTGMKHYRLQHRGGSGIINIKTTEKTGKVVTIKAVRNDDDIMVITANSMIIRYSVESIRAAGRNTQGVKAIRLKDKDLVASVAHVINASKEEEIAEVFEENPS